MSVTNQFHVLHDADEWQVVGPAGEVVTGFKSKTACEEFLDHLQNNPPEKRGEKFQANHQQGSSLCTTSKR